jgi:hypothetical protein
VFVYHGRGRASIGPGRHHDKESDVMTVPVTVYSNVG